METTRLITCDTPMEANIIKGRLENEGISSFVTNENFANLMPHFNRILNSGAQVIVKKTDYEKACEVMGFDKKAKLICPNCNSENIKPTLGKLKFRKLFIIIISLLFMYPFNNIKTSYYCKDCGSEFE